MFEKQPLQFEINVDSNILNMTEVPEESVLDLIGQDSWNTSCK